MNRKINGVVRSNISGRLRHQDRETHTRERRTIHVQASCPNALHWPAITTQNDEGAGWQLAAHAIGMGVSLSTAEEWCGVMVGTLEESCVGAYDMLGPYDSAVTTQPQPTIIIILIITIIIILIITIIIIMLLVRLLLIHYSSLSFETTSNVPTRVYMG
jgi:hypothetical protein